MQNLHKASFLLCSATGDPPWGLGGPNHLIVKEFLTGISDSGLLFFCFAIRPLVNRSRIVQFDCVFDNRLGRGRLGCIEYTGMLQQCGLDFLSVTWVVDVLNRLVDMTVNGLRKLFYRSIDFHFCLMATHS